MITESVIRQTVISSTSSVFLEKCIHCVHGVIESKKIKTNLARIRNFTAVFLDKSMSPRDDLTML